MHRQLRETPSYAIMLHIPALSVGGTSLLLDITDHYKVRIVESAADLLKLRRDWDDLLRNADSTRYPLIIGGSAHGGSISAVGKHFVFTWRSRAGKPKRYFL